MASNIPRAREIIRDVLDDINDAYVKRRLMNALSMMTRRQHVKGRVKSKPITEDLRKEIIALNRAAPDLHYSEIAHRVGVNPGRVSEVLNS